MLGCKLASVTNPMVYLVAGPSTRLERVTPLVIFSTTMNLRLEMSCNDAGLSNRLAALYDREYGVLTGRGTTALTVLFETLGIDGEVVFPGYTCEAPVYAAFYAGLKPRFCDVSFRDYTATPTDVRRRLNQATSAVVPVHTFGHPADIAGIKRAADAAGEVVVVEDACQSFPLQTKCSSSEWADVTVISCGPNKPLDSGGGGAILLDDKTLADELRDNVNRIPKKGEEKIKTLEDFEVRFRHLVDDLTQYLPEATDLLAHHHEVFRDLYLRARTDDLEGSISETIDSLPQIIEAHSRRADIYADTLRSPKIEHPDPVGDCVKNQYAIRLPLEELRNHVASELRSEGFHVSTYHSLPSRFHVADSCERAAELAAQTLQLWINPLLSEDYVRECAETVLRAVEGGTGGQ